MSTPTPLTAISGGITRLRVKGAALKSSLYDLLNAYVTLQGTTKPRGGTIRKASLSQVTKGLTAFQGTFHVFAHTPTAVPGGYECHVLVNPTNSALHILKIHFAMPFMGFLYVAAEFTDNVTYHYWLQTNGTWQANTVYMNGDYVSPTTPNGFAFKAIRLEAAHPVWQAGAAVALNDLFEPTVYNGYMFKAVAVTGTAPHTGTVEPDWPVVENAHIQEFGDFGTTSAAGGSSSSAQTPGSVVTDRYGNSGIFSSNLGTEVATSPTVEADTTIQTWLPGRLYQPGAVVQPSTGQGAFINAIPNGDFEAGADGNWAFNSPWAIATTNAYQGTKCAQFPGGAANATLLMVPHFAVSPGQSVTLTGYLNPNNTGADLTMWLNLKWYDAGDTLISTSENGVGSQGGGYRQVQFTASAPATAAFCRAGCRAASGTGSRGIGYADLFSWNLETPAAVSNFLYEAVQAAAASSGTTEPTWPVISGNTVIDNGVTWKAIGTSIITWSAIPLMKSGAVEPVWPTTVGNSVVDGVAGDGAMTWTCSDRRITDEKCPNSKYVAINSSKIFAGDEDIVAFSATTNPLDWSSPNDAGFLPFGLNTFGSEPVRGLNIYRSNLVVFNSLGYQMWQTDEDPTNMAILDASPVGTIYPKSIMPVNNDLAFETIVGIRSIGIAGASTNLQAGNFGKQVDPLVKGMLLGLTGTQEPRALFYPGSGQYWCCFGTQAIVLTINGNNTNQNWSRFSFPYEITDWTVQSGILYLRVIGPSTSDFVWQYDEGDIANPATLVDDATGGDIAIPNLIWWPYLDFGPIGLDKTLEGFDISCNGEVSVSFGYNQKDFSKVTDSYTVDGDTLDQSGMVPFVVTSVSIQPRLVFTSGQQWEWQVLNLYIDPDPNT